jgi:hypothetical protein
VWWLKAKRCLSGWGGLPSVWKRRAQGLFGCHDRETRFLGCQTQVPRQSYVVTWGKTRSIRSIGEGRILPQNEVYPVRADSRLSRNAEKRRFRGACGSESRFPISQPQVPGPFYAMAQRQNEIYPIFKMSSNCGQPKTAITRFIRVRPRNSLSATHFQGALTRVAGGKTRFSRFAEIDSNCDCKSRITRFTRLRPRDLLT